MRRTMALAHVAATLTIALASAQQITGCSLKQLTTPLVISTDGAVLEFVNLTVGHGTEAALTITGKNVVVRDVAIYVRRCVRPSTEGY